MIKRFCDIFCFLPSIFEEMHDKLDDEELVIKKILMAIVSGIHKMMISQGIPLTALVGETYEIKKENCYLFAEVRKNKNPVKINYNLNGETD